MNTNKKYQKKVGGHGCLFCTRQRICTHDSIAILYPNLLKEWYFALNTISPNTVPPRSSRKIWWCCQIKNKCECEHIYRAAVSDRTNGDGCPFCSGKKVCDHTSLAGKFPEIAEEWDLTENGKLKPNMVAPYSGKKIWWVGKKCGHSFYSSIAARTNGGSKCNICKNKTEKMLYDYFKKIYKNVEKDFKADWCINNKTNRPFPFDFLIVDYNIIVELDGIQHFKNMKCWYSEYNNIQKRDIYKMECANKNGYFVIRIKQHDVYKNIIEWNDLLKKYIKSYNTITNIFITHDNSYVNYIKEFDNSKTVIPKLKNKK